MVFCYSSEAHWSICERACGMNIRKQGPNDTIGRGLRCVCSSVCVITEVVVLCNDVGTLMGE